MLTSIIITTLNENPKTKEYIEGVYSPYEIILSMEKGLGLARNYGVKKSTGELLVFFDDDLKINPKIWNYILKLKKGYFIMSYEGYAHGNKPEPYTRCLVIHKEDFIKVGFCDEIKYSGEDREFFLYAIKKGLKPIFLKPKGFYKHIEHPIRFKKSKLIAFKMMFEHAKVLVSHGAYTRYYKGFFRWFFPYMFMNIKDKRIRLYIAKIFYSSLRDFFVLVNILSLKRYRK